MATNMPNPSFVASDHRTPGFTHVLLVTTGSVASVKAPLIVEELLRVRPFSSRVISRINSPIQHKNVKVEVVSTRASLAFFSPEAVEKAGSRVWTDEDEWKVVCAPFPAMERTQMALLYQGTYKIGDPILHIELRRWADVVLVAPCSANTLSKIAHGLCDNLVVRVALLRLSLRD